MRTSLQAIAQKAKKHKKYRFQNLYGMLDVIGLTEAWSKIKKKAAPGIDRVTAAEYGKELTKNIQETVAALKEKRYKARLVRRTYIPKGQGKVRPLGILSVSSYCTPPKTVLDLKKVLLKTSFHFHQAP